MVDRGVVLLRGEELEVWAASGGFWNPTHMVGRDARWHIPAALARLACATGTEQHATVEKGPVPGEITAFPLTSSRDGGCEGVLLLFEVRPAAPAAAPGPRAARRRASAPAAPRAARSRAR